MQDLTRTGKIDRSATDREFRANPFMAWLLETVWSWARMAGAMARSIGNGLVESFRTSRKGFTRFRLRWFDVVVLGLITAFLGLIAMDAISQIMASEDGLIHRQWCGYHEVFTPWEYVRQTAIDSTKVLAWIAVYLFIPRVFVRASMVVLTFALPLALHLFAVLF